MVDFGGWRWSFQCQAASNAGLNPNAQSRVFFCLRFLEIFSMSKCGRALLEDRPGTDLEQAAIGRQCFLLINLASHRGHPNVLGVYEMLGE